MFRDRGSFQVDDVGENPTVVFKTLRGVVAFKVTFNVDVFSPEMQLAAVKDLERRWLNRIDPPLRLVSPRPGQR